MYAFIYIVVTVWIFMMWHCFRCVEGCLCFVSVGYEPSWPKGWDFLFNLLLAIRHFLCISTLLTFLRWPCLYLSVFLVHGGFGDQRNVRHTPYLVCCVAPCKYPHKNAPFVANRHEIRDSCCMPWPTVTSWDVKTCKSTYATSSTGNKHVLCMN